MQNIIASAGMQFASFPLVPMSGITQTDTTMMNAVGQTFNFQNMLENSVTSSASPCISSIISSSQKGKQCMQQIASQHSQQQSKNEYIYQTQMDYQMENQKHYGNNQPSLMQLPIHHSHQVMNPTETAQLQSPQQSYMHALQGLQLSQPTHQQAQTSHIQSTPSSGYPENQQPIIQQFRSPALQQQSQSILRLQQSVQIQRTSPTQQTMLSSYQNHQVSGKHPNETNIHHNQLTGQPYTVSDMQQQQQPEKQWWLAIEQSNLLQMAQQQFLGEQNGVLNSHQQQLSTQENVCGLHWNSMHGLEEAEIIEDQQRAKQKSITSFLRQGEQSQSQIPQQPDMYQLHTHQTQFQQQLRAQNKSNPLQRDPLEGDMNQRIQMSSQTATLNQKHLFQFQGGHSEAFSTSDSLVPNGHKDVDGREEVHQKVRSMKEMYMPYLLGIYNKMRGQQTTNSRAMDAYKGCKFWLESVINMLNTPPSNIPPHWTVDKLLSKERGIIDFIRRCRTKRNAFPQQQGQNQLHPSVSHSLQPQISQLKHTDYQMNTLMQPINLKTSAATMHPNVLSLQHDSMPSSSSNLGVPAMQTNLVSPLQPGSDLESIHGNAPSSLQQGAVGSLQKVPLNATEQARTNTSSQNSINVLQSNIKSLQPSPNVLHHQYPNQQFHQCDMSHQLVQQQQKQNTMQQQQEQKPLQRQPHPYQMNDISDMHGKQSMNVKSGMLPQHHAEGQKSFYSHQPPLTPGALLRSLSPQSLQASSPHTSQHSPQTDPQSMISPSLSKSGTPIQSANSPMISLSPSTCFTPSPIPSDHEKQNTGAPFQSNAGGKRQAVTSGSQSHSPVIDTPGILSPALLAEVASPDKNQGCASTVISGKTIETESPTERLIKAVKSMSHKALRASVSELYSTVSVVDMIAGSNPGNHSEARVGEDLAAMVKHSLLASNFLSQDGVVTAKNMNFHSSGLPMTVVTSDGSVCHSSKLSNGMETSDLDSTATSRIKRPRVEVNEAMLEEIKDINWQLINTVLDISEENSFTSALSEVGHGTIVKCSFTPFNFSPSQAFPVLPIFLLVSVNYPNTSPVLLDKLPLSLSEEHERFLVEARSQFHRSMRCLPQPMSLREMAKSWDTCARAVLTEYALQNGGGSFSSKYGTWKNVASTS